MQIKELIKLLKQLVKFVRELMGKEVSKPKPKPTPKPVPSKPEIPKPKPYPVAWALLGQVVIDPDHSGRLAYNRDSVGDGRCDPCVVVCPGDPDWGLWLKNMPEMIQKQKVYGGNGHYLHMAMAPQFDPKANPFKNPDKPSAALNTKIINLWKTYFTAMQKAGMGAVAAFLYDDNIDFYDSYNKMTSTERGFVTNITKAFAAFPNIIPCIAEEEREAVGVQRAKEIARAIQKAAPHRRLIGSHQNHGIGFAHSNDPLIKLFLIQWNHADRHGLHKAMVQAFKMARGRFARIMAESIDPNMKNTYGSGTTARLKDWACIMGGANGVMRYGFKYRNQDLKDMRIAQRFFESVRTFNELLPADHLKYAGTEYVLAGKSSWILYSSKRIKYLGRKNAIAGSHKLKWLDIKTGRILKKTSINKSGQIGYIKPKGFGQEAVLLVERI